MKKILVFSFFFFLSVTVWSQLDYTTQYRNGKDLFRQAKYNLAMETFKPLITYDAANPYSAYASFYYALAAYKQGYKTVAKDMLTQLKTVHPKWDKMDDVNLWLAKIFFDNHDYFQGMKNVNAIADKKLSKDIEALKTQYISAINDAETLKMMLEEFPKDEVVARYLARSLSKNLTDEADRKELESLIDRFKLQRTDFIPEAPKTFFKDRYAVSVLLPFMLDKIDGSPGKKRNQIVLDFYEGVKLGVDTLNKQNVKISLRAYDTDKGVENLKRVLETEELKNTDLIIGPLYPNENTLVQEFSMAHQVNVVNPFSNNTDLIGENPYAYLFQPSSETLGKKAAEYVAAHARKNICMVFYGTSNKKDSVLAANFTEKANELGLKVVVNEAVKNQDGRNIMEILATPTEFDEFKYASEFTLKKDSIASIFVATDDPLIYTKVISAVETRKDSIMIVGSENWIDDTAVAFEKFQTLGIVMTAPNYVPMSHPHRKEFLRKYMKAYGKVPSNLSKLGYELMLFFGNQLKTNGVYFQDGLNKAENIPGYLSQGFKYQNSRDNQSVPFVKFRGGVLTLIEKR
jgi:ABC-type branched-subunit amino acid transport system substrate-binding protein